MSKYIYRLVAFVFISCVSLVAEEVKNTDEIVQSIIQKYKKIANEDGSPKNKEVQGVINNTQKNAQNSNDMKEMFKENANIAKKLGNFAAAEKLEDYATNYSKYTKKVPTIFYFYSTSMDKIALERFYNKLKRIQNEFYQDNVQGYAVFRGFPEDLKNFGQKYNKESIAGGKFKFHPFMYRFYGLNAVPAFAFAYCNQDFSFKSCEGHLLVKGDISLDEALRIFTQENKKLQAYYDLLATPK